MVYLYSCVGAKVCEYKMNKMMQDFSQHQQPNTDTSIIVYVLPLGVAYKYLV